MSDEDGFEPEDAFEAVVFIGALIAMGIGAITIGVWTWLAVWNP